VYLFVLSPLAGRRQADGGGDSGVKVEKLFFRRQRKTKNKLVRLVECCTLRVGSNTRKYKTSQKINKTFLPLTLGKNKLVLVANTLAYLPGGVS
jgi:hypothetical protein